MARTLASLEITNGEGAEIELLAAFLEWMRIEAAPVPADRPEFLALMVRWIQFERHMSMQRLRDEGKISEDAFKRITYSTRKYWRNGNASDEK